MPNKYSIVACLFIAMGTCIPGHCLAMNVYSDFQASCDNIKLGHDKFLPHSLNFVILRLRTRYPAKLYSGTFWSLDLSVVKRLRSIFVSWRHRVRISAETLTQGFVVFLTSFRQMLSYSFKLGQGLFLSDTFQFITNNPIIPSYIVVKQTINKIGQCYFMLCSRL
jgi:hypothetical protein